MACRQTVTLLHHGNPDEALARQILGELTALPPASDMLRAVDTGERIFFAESMLALATDRGDDSSPDEGLDSLPLKWMQMDWNHVLREGNRWFDRLVTAGKTADPSRADGGL